MPNRIQGQPFGDTGQQICNSLSSVPTTRLVALLSIAGKIESCDGKVLVHSREHASTYAWLLLLKRRHYWSLIHVQIRARYLSRSPWLGGYQTNGQGRVLVHQWGLTRYKIRIVSAEDEPLAGDEQTNIIGNNVKNEVPSKTHCADSRWPITCHGQDITTGQNPSQFSSI